MGEPRDDLGELRDDRGRQAASPSEAESKAEAAWRRATQPQPLGDASDHVADPPLTLVALKAHARAGLADVYRAPQAWEDYGRAGDAQEIIREIADQQTPWARAKLVQVLAAAVATGDDAVLDVPIADVRVILHEDDSATVWDVVAECVRHVLETDLWDTFEALRVAHEREGQQAQAQAQEDTSR